MYLAFSFVNWLEQNMITCWSKKYLHIECPGCGLQRSFIALLKGNFYQSFILNAATIPILLLGCFLVIHLFFKLPNGAKILQGLQLFTAGVLVFQYIIKQYFWINKLLQ